ncbi:MAG: hypothetical protein ABIL86_00220 [candidate division WOR-3 bacterium]
MIDEKSPPPQINAVRRPSNDIVPDQGTNLKKDIIFRMEAKANYLIFTNLGGIILGGILLFILLSLRNLYTTAIFLIGFVILILYMVIDFLIWLQRGIRAIEIDKSGINFYRGKERRLVRINKEQITGIDFFTKLGRRIVTIMIGGKVIKPTAYITLFSGPRIRIADDSFNDGDFSAFVELLKKFQSDLN